MAKQQGTEGESEKVDARPALWNWGFMAGSDERAHTSEGEVKCFWLVDLENQLVLCKGSWTGINAATCPLGHSLRCC